MLVTSVINAATCRRLPDTKGWRPASLYDTIRGRRRNIQVVFLAAKVLVIRYMVDRWESWRSERRICQSWTVLPKFGRPRVLYVPWKLCGLRVIVPSVPDSITRLHIMFLGLLVS
jgi:hypothetical protein